MLHNIIMHIGLLSVINSLLIQWGAIPVDYNNTNTEVLLPLTYPQNNYYVFCEMGNCPANGVANHCVNRFYNTSSKFNIWGDYTASTMTGVETSWISIGF